MRTIKRHASDRVSGVTWTAVTGVQPVVFVVRLDDQPFAIAESLPSRRFRVTRCSGSVLGEFGSLDACRLAVDDDVRAVHHPITA